MAPRCTLCGGPATISAASLDPRWPLGVCEKGHKGQALVPVATDRQRFERLAAGRRRELDRRAHARHLAPGGKLSKRCAACQGMAPAQEVVHAGA
jgi:hypothetical protein